MSRDWTPREHYASIQANVAEGHGDYWHFLEKSVMSFNGSLTRLYPDEEIVLRKQFPVLGKLITNVGDYNFVSLYKKLSAIDGGLDLLSAKDKELTDFISSGEGDKEGYLIKWFLGELDPAFHYATYNDRLLGESLIKDALIRSSINKPVVFPLTESFTVEIKAIDELSGNNVASMLDCQDYVWGLLKDQKVIGYCTVGGADELVDEEVVEYPGYSSGSLLLSDVFVVPEYRGQGGATFLVNEVVKAVTKQEKELVFLTLLDDNLSHLYEKCGFEVIGRGVMVRDDRVKSIDAVLTDAEQICEDVNKGVGETREVSQLIIDN